MPSRTCRDQTLGKAQADSTPSLVRQQTTATQHPLSASLWLCFSASRAQSPTAACLATSTSMDALSCQATAGCVVMQQANRRRRCRDADSTCPPSWAIATGHARNARCTRNDWPVSDPDVCTPRCCTTVQSAFAGGHRDEERWLVGNVYFRSPWSQKSRPASLLLGARRWCHDS
jgi:hypothetical protein